MDSINTKPNDFENHQIERLDKEVSIEPFNLEDAETHLANEDADQQRWISGGQSTLESVQNWIKKNQEYWQNGGPVFNFALRINGELVGMVEANIDKNQVEGLEEGDANISYALYPKARGKGYATKAVNFLVEYLKKMGLKRAVLRIDKDNAPSLKIPLACGFEEAGEIDTSEGRMLIFRKNLQS
jgi:RimJ/RimL family protein N-acetyltransferase